MATDLRGRDHRFPLNRSESAPSEFLHHSGWWTIVDQRGEGLIRGSNDDWDTAEIEDLTRAAGIAWRWDLGGVLPEMREDGITLQPSLLGRWAVPVVGGASGITLAVAYLLPTWVAGVYFATILGVALYAWQAGALAPARRSKSTPRIEAYAAKIEQERLEKYGPQWQPPVRGRWRLAIELQFGILFAGAVVLFVRGEYGPAAVYPLVSLLVFFYTRYVFPGIWWNWWAWAVLGNVGAFILFLTTFSV